MHIAIADQFNHLDSPPGKENRKRSRDNLESSSSDNNKRLQLFSEKEEVELNKVSQLGHSPESIDGSQENLRDKVVRLILNNKVLSNAIITMSNRHKIILNRKEEEIKHLTKTNTELNIENQRLANCLNRMQLLLQHVESNGNIYEDKRPPDVY